MRRFVLLAAAWGLMLGGPLRSDVFLCAAESPPSTTASATPALPTPSTLALEPQGATIYGRHGVQRLLTTGKVDGKPALHDYSRAAKYASSDPTIATVTSDGVVIPLTNGTVEITADFAGKTATTKVTVVECDHERPISFRSQIVPVFSKFACNSGGCHGKASGQNGFRLSLLGFDADFDYMAIVKAGRGRRVFPAAPDNSLLLQKAVGSLPHGGGQRIKPESEEYKIVRRWIEQGMPPGTKDDPTLVRIECTPKSAILNRDAQQQILVTGYFSDGRSRDITRSAIQK
ncbi:MAG: hypothetical protein QM811_31830 [Pirellulales bacterium]